MKTIKFIPLLLLVTLVTSCSTVKVASDYDKNATFDAYSTYAFFKPGVDKAEVSDLDKKRILRAIDVELSAKGLQKSETPDLLISFFTESKQRVDIYQNHYGWGGYWGWGWGHPWGYQSVSKSTEGTLFIDIIDAQKNELIWQGMGTAPLITGDVDKKEERIQLIVKEILKNYPPD